MDPCSTITDQILGLLERGTVPWHRPWSAGGVPLNLLTRKPYRGINLWLLVWQPYSSPYWVTEKQLQKIGGCVRSHEQATVITFWKVLAFRAEQNINPTNPGNERGVLPLRPAWVFRTYRVFNSEQCELSPRWAARLTQEQPSAPVACAQVVTEMRHPPVIEHGTTAAYYRPSTDTIHLPFRTCFESGESYFATLFHELVHSTGHSQRLARPSLIEACPFGSTNYSKEELIAEMGAAFLCGVTGISNQTIDQSAAYIAAWMRRLREDRRLAVHAAAQAQKAMEWILGTNSSASSLQGTHSKEGVTDVR